MTAALFWLVLLPILFGVAAYLFPLKKAVIPTLLFQLFFLFLAGQNFLAVKAEGIRLEVLGGYPLGVGISLKSDSVSAVLIALTAFLFTNMILFSYRKAYFDPLFRLLYFMLEGLICAFFLSNDLFNIFVLIEASTIIVSILIVFKKHSRSVYDGIIYLFTNFTAASFFLFGIGVLYRYFGVLDIDLLSERIAQFSRPQALYLPFALIATGLSLKAAVLPLFSWLPKAHGSPASPSVVSAVLSGIYIKGGLFLFVRVSAIFAPVIPVGQIYLVLGALTCIAGFILALSQTDIKLILAYHTVSQVGLMMLGISLGTKYGYYGAFYHLINHAVFKSTLFLTAGIMVEEYHTRNLYQIKGFFQKQPAAALATLVAMLGITGAPLFSGSYSKYLIEKGGAEIAYFSLLILIINLGTLSSFVKYANIFRRPDEAITTEKLPWNQKLVLLLLSLATFLGGIFGPVLTDVFFGVRKDLSLADYGHKLWVYLACAGGCYLFYRFVYHRISLFKKLRQMEFSFNQIIFLMLLFFSSMYFYLTVFVS